MTPLDLLQSHSSSFIVVATVLGLMIGSFLNVVIYRLPIMLERQWRAQCRELLEPAATGERDRAATSPERFDLVFPRSRCPNCGHNIRAWENIPVISYLFLGGRCSACRTTIAWRYPVIELLTGALSGVVAWQFGFGLAAAAALLLTWGLIALSVIDFDHQLLPDSVTLPLLWLGLLLSLKGVFADAPSSIIGAVVGYLSLWFIYKSFKWLTGKEGMGYGDFKLFAVFGAWMGWQALVPVILLSSFAGAIIGLALIALRGHDKSVPIPFGPYLAIAGWVNLLWGERILAAYWSLIL